MRDYNAAVGDALAPLLSEALKEGPTAMLRLLSALYEVTRKAETARGEMVVSPVFECRDCAKFWTVALPYARCRDVQPSNCPTCYNAAPDPTLGTFTGPRRSGWTDVFRYCDGPRFDP